MLTIGCGNLKGGVGKTTCTVNLGAGLARSGWRVLLVDADPQAHLTVSLGVTVPAGGGLAGVLGGLPLHVVTGEELAGLSGEALIETVEKHHVFAKLDPMLRFLRSVPPLAADDIRFEDIQASGDTELIVRYLAVAAKDRGAVLSRLAPAFAALVRLPDAGRAGELLDAFTTALPPLLATRLRAEFAVLRQAPETALPLVENLDREAWGLYAAVAASCLLERLGDRTGALTDCLAVRRLLPFHVNLTLRAHSLAMAFTEGRQYIEAYQYLDQALTLDPDLWRSSDAICCNIATVFRRYGKKEQAVEYLQKALTLNPDSTKAKALLSEIER